MDGFVVKLRGGWQICDGEDGDGFKAVGGRRVTRGFHDLKLVADEGIEFGVGVVVVGEVDVYVVIAISRGCRRVDAGNIVVLDEYRGVYNRGGCKGEGAL